MRARIILTLALLTSAACAPLTSYRTDYGLCVSSNPDLQCPTHALQQYNETDGSGYLLGFIELDDQGQLFDRAQMQAVLGAISTEVAPDSQDFLMVVFVHGWKHNAAPGDDNIATFRRVLVGLSKTEQAVSVATGARPRKVIGVYIGWRGASITAWGLKEATFWDRKNTAHKVGHGDVTEVLNRLDLIRQTKDSMDGGQSESRLVIVGHSFGGAVVFAAVSQILEERFVRTVGPSGVTSDAGGFGNLVVLINPAFEAQLLSSLSDMSLERATYFNSQLPVLIVMTSEADDATRIAFPLGRWFSTFFEKVRTVPRNNPISGTVESISQKASNVRAVGHFEPYRTHYLKAVSTPAAALRAAQPALSVSKVGEAWENDVPGSTIEFPEAALTRTDRSAGRNPYLVVRVDRKLIPNHNDITDPRVVQFVTHMILVSSQSADVAKRSSRRQRVLSK